MQLCKRSLRGHSNDMVVAYPICRSGLMCETCRTSAAWRASFAAAWNRTHPPIPADFPCPHGLTNGFAGPAPWAAEGATVAGPDEAAGEARKRAVCAECAHVLVGTSEAAPYAETQACRMLPGANGRCSPCDLSARIRDGGPCPHPHGDMWKTPPSQEGPS